MLCCVVADLACPAPAYICLKETVGLDELLLNHNALVQLSLCYTCKLEIQLDNNNSSLALTMTKKKKKSSLLRSQNSATALAFSPHAYKEGYRD